MVVGLILPEMSFPSHRLVALIRREALDTVHDRGAGRLIGWQRRLVLLERAKDPVKVAGHYDVRD